MPYPEGCTVANAYHHEAPIAEWVMAAAVALDHELLKSERTFRAGSWEMWPGRHGVVPRTHGSNLRHHRFRSNRTPCRTTRPGLRNASNRRG